MSAFGVVLDANVLISAAIRDTLLRAADEGLYRLIWSDQILNEVQRNLVATLALPEEKAQKLIDTMTEYFPEALVSHHVPLIDSMTNDQKDRHVLAVAVASGSQVIVTNNLRDFPKRAVEMYNIEVQSPDTFLIHLLDLDPRRMTEILRTQAQDLTSPAMTFEELLEKLDAQVPTFVRSIKERLSSARLRRVRGDPSLSRVRVLVGSSTYR